MFAFASDFIKEVSKFDRKLQGRVLKAISEICRHPMRPYGDTVKELSGELAGRWRYRLGDYRLICRPDPVRQAVYLLSFGPRGSVYED